MSGEEHMKFTWSYELVGPNALMALVKALQKSVKERDDICVVQLDEFREKFSKLYGYAKTISAEHFHEPIRFLRKSGVVWVERGQRTRNVVSARSGTELEVDKDILRVNIDNEKDIFGYIAKRAYGFHIPFSIFVDIVQEHSEGIRKEVLRETLSEKMLEYARTNYPEYFKEKQRKSERGGKTWKYSLAHFNELLAVTEKAGWTTHENDTIKKASKGEEAKVTYEEFRNTVLDEYSRMMKGNPNLLMVSVDKLRSTVSPRLRISEKTYEKMMHILILRNLGRIKVYRQKAEEEEKGLIMPDGTRIYAVAVKSDNAL
jgi:hypothetical protein